MRPILPLLAALLCLAGAVPSALALDGWAATRDEGLALAKKSGKPVLVLTAWKDGV